MPKRRQQDWKDDVEAALQKPARLLPQTDDRSRRPRYCIWVVPSSFFAAPSNEQQPAQSELAQVEHRDTEVHPQSQQKSPAVPEDIQPVAFTSPCHSETEALNDSETSKEMKALEHGSWEEVATNLWPRAIVAYVALRDAVETVLGQRAKALPLGEAFGEGFGWKRDVSDSCEIEESCGNVRC